MVSLPTLQSVIRMISLKTGEDNNAIIGHVQKMYNRQHSTQPSPMRSITREYEDTLQ